MAMRLYPHISADTQVLSRQPVIEGTAISVSRIVSEAATGKSLHDIAQEYGVSIEDVRAALEYAAQRTSEPIALAADTHNEEENASQAEAKPTMAEEEARRLGLDPTTLSPLGRRLLELRARAIAAGEPLLTTWEELNAEIAERRGGFYLDADA